MRKLIIKYSSYNFFICPIEQVDGKINLLNIIMNPSYIRRNIDGVVIERRESSTSSVISSLVDGNRLLSENGLTFIYILDKVVGFIYNNIRYYDLETCRFISLDVISIIDETSNTINGLNLYMYCNDNPVMMVDSSISMPTNFVNVTFQKLMVYGTVTRVISNLFSSIFKNIPENTRLFIDLLKNDIDFYDSVKIAYL